MRRAHLGGAVMAGAMGLLLTAGQAQAQFPLAIVAGPTFANVSTDGFDTSSRTGFFAGLGTMLSLGETVGVAPYVSFVQKGAQFASDSGEDVYSYIEIPVLLSVGVPVGETVGLQLSAGPQVAFNIKCNEKVPGQPDYDCKEYNDYNGSTEFGLVGSVGLRFPVGSSTLGIGAGYDLGLTDVFSDIPGGYKNRAFFIAGSYGVQLGGM